MKTRLLKYAAITLFVLLLSAVYNRFGHGIHSVYMDFAFLVPLVCGLLSILIRSEIIRVFFHYGMWTLLAYALLRGIVEIAGTDSPFISAFLWVGLGFVGTALICSLFAVIKHNGTENGTNG